MLAVAAAMHLADFGNFIPFLFILYVIYAIFTSVSKAIRQAAQSQQAASSSDTSTALQMTAADVRLALQRRLTAAAAARAQATAVQAAQSAQPVARPAPIVSISASSTLANLGSGGDASQMQSPPDLSLLFAPTHVNLSTLLASLPPAAQAIVASAVIGPCAAHRGGGHTPEDW
ncbi:MAG TPA: hypothetical protein VFO25_04575 [Candidatus Eremiobacteraceae bacterium]|nr:hypothetical protein [Candidatus Eremiobacteraceae bacterium]